MWKTRLFDGFDLTIAACKTPGVSWRAGLGKKSPILPFHGMMQTNWEFINQCGVRSLELGV